MMHHSAYGWKLDRAQKVMTPIIVTGVAGDGKFLSTANGDNMKVINFETLYSSTSYSDLSYRS